MILGLGLDIIEHSRFDTMNLLSEFIKKHFTDSEQEIFYRKSKLNCRSVANNFAAKEAFSKALGTGVRGFSLNEVEVLRDEMGKPYINLYGSAKRAFESKNGKNILVSISDTDSVSTAVVIIEG